jgi:flagellar motor switch protein FliM
MCIPYISIEKYMDKLVIQYKTKVSYRDGNEFKKTLERSINSVEINALVELGRSYITIDDFLNLSVGDCLTLNKKTTQPLQMYIDNNPYFDVYPGTVGNNVGVQISEILDKDVEENE